MLTARFDVTVVGAGLAGITAAAVAAAHGRRVALVATGAGGFVLTPMTIATRELQPLRASAEAAQALSFFQQLCASSGCALDGGLAEQRFLPTLTGGLEPIAFAPRSLWQSTLPVEGMVAIAGIDGLSGFDPRFMAELLNREAGQRGLRAKFIARTLHLPQAGLTPTTTLRLAHRLDREPEFRTALITELRAAAVDCALLLVPGVLGLHTTDALLHSMELEAGCRLGELPTLPPAIPGLRLYNCVMSWLSNKGVQIFSGFPVEAIVKNGSAATLQIARPGRALNLSANAILLATATGSTRWMQPPGLALAEDGRQQVFGIGADATNSALHTSHAQAILDGYKLAHANRAHANLEQADQAKAASENTTEVLDEAC